MPPKGSKKPKSQAPITGETDTGLAANVLADTDEANTELAADAQGNLVANVVDAQANPVTKAKPKPKPKAGNMPDTHKKNRKEKEPKEKKQKSGDKTKKEPKEKKQKDTGKTKKESKDKKRKEKHSSALKDDSTVAGDRSLLLYLYK